jgi:RNA polymerase sigma-70 factor (ECF subfamily)
VVDASEDRALLRRLAAGDREALEPLMARHYRRVYRIALGYLRNPDDALDVVQETFVKGTRRRRWGHGWRGSP